MWLTLPFGFFSIVAIPKDDHNLLIRARVRKHLVAAKRYVIASNIVTTPQSDYKFRMIARRVDVANWMTRSISQIDYTNFKDAAHARYPKDQDWSRALGNVWMDMYELQEPTARQPLGNVDLGLLDSIERRYGVDPIKNPPPPQET